MRTSPIATLVNRVVPLPFTFQCSLATAFSPFDGLPNQALSLSKKRELTTRRLGPARYQSEEFWINLCTEKDIHPKTDRNGKSSRFTPHKYGNMGTVKTTLEIPDFLFRRAKSAAAQRGIPLRQLVTEAVQEKLKTTSQEKPWMKHLGKLKHLHKERKQIEKRVEEAFERIDREVWQ
ncbi:MAG: hypothetical protein ACLPOO_02165 [Terriglobales bacterium]